MCRETCRGFINRTALSSFKTITDFQRQCFNAGKPRQYQEEQKELVRINEIYSEYLGPLTLVTKPSESDKDEIRLIET